MKRYERMSKEEIIEAFKTMDKCETCRFNDKCPCGYDGCCEQMTEYLNEEIKLKTVSRWQTIKSDEDLKKMRQDFRDMCNGRKCSSCLYPGGIDGCFINYLLEKIEVEETE